MRQAKDWTGVKQGRLNVFQKLPRGKYADRYVAQCECGQLVVIEGNYVAAGTQSCGCLQRDAARQANTTHGDSKTRLYSRWTSMLRLARHPHSKVQVNPEWYFWQNFKRDIGELPPDVHIRRVDKSLPFGPDNVQLVKVAA